MRSLGKKLEIATYAHDKVVTFRLTSRANEHGNADSYVAVPLPIMFRYYHLGRAYDLHQLKNLHPAEAHTIDFTSIQLLALELEQVSELVGDPVIRHYGNRLVSYLAAAREATKDNLTVFSPI
mgnify:CR=1 FL=1|jgi:hypothetical protein